MATSLVSLDKYAVLVSGSTELRYIRDIENVYKTIRDYYGYLEDHIWVILGNGTNLPANVPSARLKILTESASTSSDFTDYFNQFVNAAKVPPLPKLSLPEPFRNSRRTGNLNTALVYFTGKGTHLDDDFQIVIGRDDTSTDVPINTLQLNLMLSDGDLINNCHIQVVMQQDYADGFEENFWNLGLISSGSWTYACHLSAAHTGKFADEITFTGDDSADFLVSLERAKNFVAWYSDTVITGVPGYKFKAVQKQYLGLPQFLIRDGDPVWISPDVYLEHPEPYQSDMDYPGSQYVVDSGTEHNNWIHVVVRNHGTHPVRKYDLGAIVFLAGCSGSGNSDDTTLDNSILGGILCPVPCNDPVQPDDGAVIRSFDFMFDTIQFTNQNHRCLRGIAKLSDGTAFNYESWDLAATDDRAQRNIDFWEASKSSSGNTGGGADTDDISGKRKGTFRIENMFKVTRKFFLVLPPELEQLSPVLKSKFSVTSKNKISEPRPVVRVKGIMKHLEFTLQPGKYIDIDYEFKVTPKFRPEKDIQLHFPIAVEAHPKLGKKWPGNFISFPDMALLGGVTIVVLQGSADVSGQILYKGSKSPKPVQFVIHTQGKNQVATIKAFKDGTFNLKGIDPGIYRYYATDGVITSPDKLLVLKNKVNKKVIIELTEKIKVPPKKFMKK